MPKYVFECLACSVRFERFLKMDSYMTYPCKECGEDAPRVVTEFGFAFASGGTDPANSGVHAHDYPTADMAVGKSAEARWQVLEARNQAKVKAREIGGTHALIRKDGPGYTDYEPMSKTGREARAKMTRAIMAKVKDPK